MDLIEGDEAKEDFAMYMRRIGNDILDGKYVIEEFDLEETFDEPQSLHDIEFLFASKSYTKRDRTINIHLRIKESK